MIETHDPYIQGYQDNKYGKRERNHNRYVQDTTITADLWLEGWDQAEEDRKTGFINDINAVARRSLQHPILSSYNPTMGIHTHTKDGEDVTFKHQKVVL